MASAHIGNDLHSGPTAEMGSKSHAGPSIFFTFPTLYFSQE